MGQLAAIAFLLAHGFVHVAVWAMPTPAENAAPFDPNHSWALAAGHVAPTAQRTTSAALAWLAGVLFAAAGVALALDLTAWTTIAVAAGGVGLVLKALCFNLWLSLGVVLDVAVLVAAASNWPSI